MIHRRDVCHAIPNTDRILVVSLLLFVPLIPFCILCWITGWRCCSCPSIAIRVWIAIDGSIYSASHIVRDVVWYQILEYKPELLGDLYSITEKVSLTCEPIEEVRQ